MRHDVKHPPGEIPVYDGPWADSATVHLGDETWHDGPGWYWVDDEYPDEGTVGAFATREEAERHAKEYGYAITPSKESP